MTPPLIIAELSCNHLGDRDRAFRIAEAAAWAGADLFKVQVWTPDRMCIDSGYALTHGPWAGRRLVDLYREAHTPWEWLPDLFAHCRKIGMEPFGAAFDRASVDYLCELGVERLKVASFELTDLPLIRYMASKGKPMILSTGMATMEEIKAAVMCATPPGGPRNITVLYCVSAYPAPQESIGIGAMVGIHRRACDWTQNFGRIDMGLSDHTLTNEAAIVATAFEAGMIEKHLTLSRADGGPDAGFSLEPHEFKSMVDAVRRTAAIYRAKGYGPQPGEDTTLRRGLWVIKDIEPGEPLRLEDNVITARPALGLPPSFDLSNKRAARALKANQPLMMEDIA